MTHPGPDPATRAAIARFVDRLRADFPIRGALLFGSRARGTGRPDSDADVAVLLRGERQRMLPTKLAMAEVAFDVLLETGIRIQPLPVWEDEWADPDSTPNASLLHTIAREGIAV
jgi:predicted nucleotidyltransferase